MPYVQQVPERVEAMWAVGALPAPSPGHTFLRVSADVRPAFASPCAPYQDARSSSTAALNASRKIGRGYPSRTRCSASSIRRQSPRSSTSRKQELPRQELQVLRLVRRNEKCNGHSEERGSRLVRVPSSACNALSRARPRTHLERSDRSACLQPLSRAC